MWNDALPRNGITNWKVYYAVQGTDTTTGWQTWMKPAGCAWIYVLMIAAGSGGNRIANGSQTGGGGAGASGGHTRLLIPAFVVPDILYIRPGAGGLGATSAGTNGTAGVVSYIAMQPNTTVANSLLAQAGGGAGIGQGGGAPGGVGITTPAIQCLGLFTTVNGIGAINGANALNGNGSGPIITNSSITTPGGGGGNGTGAGGSIFSSSIVYPQINGGAGSTGGSGQAGFQLGAMWTPGLKSFPLIFSGGSGGGGSSAVNGVAGAGGNASYGGGGGGGGSCTDAGGTSGNGGNGGDGIIFIGAF